MKFLGYIIFAISCVIWAMIVVVPFLGFSAGKLAAITTGLIVAGEITFYFSIFLIGKEFLLKIKAKFKRKKTEKEQEQQTLS
jgi:hypothetical protein